MNLLGIDIGGSGIKAAVVDIRKGELVSERLRIPTPQPSLPEDVSVVIKDIILQLDYQGPVGIGFPAAITQGLIRTASNIDQSWKGLQAEKYFTDALGMPAYVLNDADAAGYAEIGFGEGKGVKGVVIAVTVGTGIGTAVFNDGKLLPNTEFGHLIYKKGDIAEHHVSDAARKANGMSWHKWGKRFNKYLLYLETLTYPSLFIIGGGASRKFEKYADCFTTNAQVKPALHRNHAGLIGAAIHAQKQTH